MDYDLVVCVDAYAAIHLVMPTMFNNVDAWIQACASRNDVPEDVWGCLTEARLNYDREYIRHIRDQRFGFSSEHIVTFLSYNWQYESG